MNCWANFLSLLLGSRPRKLAQYCNPSNRTKVCHYSQKRQHDNAVFLAWPTASLWLIFFTFFDSLLAWTTIIIVEHNSIGSLPWERRTILVCSLHPYPFSYHWHLMNVKSCLSSHQLICWRHINLVRFINFSVSLFVIITGAKTFLEHQKRIWNEQSSTLLATQLPFNLLSQLIIPKK